MDSAWVGVIGSLGGVLLTSGVGLAGAGLNHRWQDDARKKEREERLHESRAALRRDAYTRFLIASDRVADFLVTQPPNQDADEPIDPQTAIEKTGERLRELWIEGNEHIVEYTAALMQGRLLASPEVATALEEFDDWMEKQFGTIAAARNPMESNAFADRDRQREPLIQAMRLEQETDLLLDDAD